MISYTFNSTIFRSQNGNNNWQSVADRISELERQQKSPNSANPYNQKYTYLDPSKTTRVPNPALKAFQKNAVQSYFERQQSTAKEKEAARNLINSQQTIKNPPRPQSLPIQSNTPKLVVHSRSSLPNNISQLNSISPNNKSPQQLSVMTSPTNHCSTSTAVNQPITITTTPTTTSSPISQLVPESPTILTSPSYQATFHQAPTVYNIPMVATATNLSNEHYNRSPTATNLSNEQYSMSYNGNICKVVSVEDVSLQSANESGVPPPPPRRSRPMIPTRR